VRHHSASCPDDQKPADTPIPRLLVAANGALTNLSRPDALKYEGWAIDGAHDAAHAVDKYPHHC